MKMVTGLFTPTNAFRTLDHLMENGFVNDDLSMISSVAQVPDYLEGEPEDAAVSGTVAGAFVGGTLAALGTWGVSTIPGFETMLAAGFLNTAAGSVIGGFLGSLYKVRAESQTTIDIHEELASGKMLMIVKTDAQGADMACALMEQGEGESIEIHDISLTSG